MPDNKAGRALAYALLAAAVIAVFVIAAVLGKSLFDSNNPQSVPVPNVKGMTQAAAEKELTALGLKVTAEEANNDTSPRQRVRPEPRGQHPAQGRPDRHYQGVDCGVAEVVVPNLVGLSVDTATRQLSDAGLELGNPKYVASDQTRNLITKSTPKAGKTVAKGSTVDVEVASGQNTVPDVTGKSNTEAASILENAGFTPRELPRETTDAKPGTVVDQTPAGKKLARLGSTVTIFVAQAPTETPTPTPTDTASLPPPLGQGRSGGRDDRRQAVAPAHRVGVAAGRAASWRAGGARPR